MLKIRLSQPTYCNRKYTVFLDRNWSKSFRSKRQATDYITQVENELNEALLFVNEYFNIIHTFYRTYFLADRDFRFKYEVENCFEFINDRLNYISGHTDSPNYNTFVIMALSNSFETLIQACELIDKKSRSRYDMLTRRRISLYRKLAGLYKDSFEIFKIEIGYNTVLKLKTG